MTTDTTTIVAQPRDVTGKTSRRLARQGQIPAVLYGAIDEAMSIMVDKHDFEIFMSTHASGSALVSITIDGEKEPFNAVIKEVQHSPVKGEIMHVDFLAVRMDEKLQANVALHLIGESAGVFVGGVLMQNAREVLVEALPADLPDSLDIDISALEIGDSLHFSDLETPEGVEMVDDPAGLICSVTLPTAEVVEEEVEGEEEDLEPELIGEDDGEEAEETEES